MLEDLWNSILELTQQLVIPDWGVLVNVALPVGTVALTLLGLVWIFWRLFRQPPPRRGVTRIEPKPPGGVHMPGPSFSPIFAAIGTGLLFLGLVFGGPALALGAIALVLTLLYWGREGLHLYDHDVEPTRVSLPPVSTVPPPGIHMPGPSFRPILGALGTALLFLGLVFGGLLLAVGVIALILTLVGWLGDARREYVNAVNADRTGHLDSLPAPRTPARLLATLALLLVAATVLQSGVLGGTTGPGGSPPPGASAPAPPPEGGGVPSPSGAPSGAPAEQPPGPEGDVTVEASGVAFLQTTWTGPADTPFGLAFINSDPGVPHNIELKDAAGASVFKGEIFNGVETRVYDVPALPAGDYPFICSVHPNMTGTATLQ